MQLTGFARLIALPENHSALTALAEVARSLPDATINPLYLHGPAGTGKSCLVAALVEETAANSSCVLSANAFPLPWDQEDASAAKRHDDARRCELLIVEDLQHLPAWAAETLVLLLDERLRRRLATVVTASAGPAQLAPRDQRLPVRLCNRMAGGLVVALQPFEASSRWMFLEELSRQHGLVLAADVLTWLAETLTGGGRQLEGAIHQVEALTRFGRGAPTLRELQAHFAASTDAGQPTMERIVRRVSAYFHLAPRQLRSPRRERRLLIARQVSMYLARRLTPLSLEQIGACFGGRDHTTVLHACRKVEHAMQHDLVLSGAVHDLQAGLT